MAEFYIREADSEEARGPYPPERIADLIEAGRASADTLYYDEAREDWFPISEIPELQNTFHPQEKRIHLRTKSQQAAETNRPPALEQEDEVRPAVSVNEMLAAAEGKSAETKHLKAREKRMNKAAALSLPALAIMMALCAFTDIFPHWDAVMTLKEERTWSLLLQYPMLILGVVDVFLLLCCILSATDAFPIIRMRAMLGLAFSRIFTGLGETSPKALPSRSVLSHLHLHRHAQPLCRHPLSRSRYY